MSTRVGDQDMSEPADFRQLDDPAFLAERAHLRGLLEHVAANALDRTELERVYEAMNQEFDRRARIAWAKACQGLEPARTGLTRVIA